MAIRIVPDGRNLRRAARRLPIQHPTMVSWKRQAAKRLPATPPQPQLVQQVELDEVVPLLGTTTTVLPPSRGRPHHAHDSRLGTDGRADG